tara:strand:+ start:25 stop:597 length:573 start_codon:yes stop_codon:yes gene_type:complete
MSEGGLRVPLIISGPEIKKGKNQSFAFVTDIAATLSDIVFDEVDERIIGKSLQNSLSGFDEKNYLDTESVGLEVTGNSALFKGDFKIVRNRPPNGSNQWELYNLFEDPGETINLATSMPNKLKELIKDYETYAEKNGVIELPLEYEWAAEMTVNTFKRNYLPLIRKAVLFSILAIFVVIVLTKKWRNAKI